MYKYTLGIDGMACGACEAHVKNKLIRRLNCKKVKASHIKNNVVVYSEEVYKEDDFKKILDPTGYIVTSYQCDLAEKKLFGWR